MPYYRGDFYMGDPGFFSLFRGVGRVIGGLTGLGGGGRKVITVAAPAAAGAASTGIVRPAIRQAIERVGGVIQRHPVLSAAGAAAAAATITRPGVPTGRMRVPGAEGVPTKGFHVSKRTGQLVRNRRMRVTNPKALRRAIRRATGFARLARRVLHFTSPRAPRGRAIFRHRRRAAKQLRA